MKKIINELNQLINTDLYVLPTSTTFYSIGNDQYILDLQVVRFLKPQPNVTYYKEDGQIFPTLVGYIKNTADEVVKAIVFEYFPNTLQELEQCIKLAFETFIYKH